MEVPMTNNAGAPATTRTKRTQQTGGRPSLDPRPVTAGEGEIVRATSWNRSVTKGGLL